MSAPDAQADGDLTWPALLAQWTRFAQASVALPRTPTGDRWRAAVPAIIALQSLTHALGELHRLPPGERALALDRAEVLIKRHEAELLALFGTVEGELAALTGDARSAARAGRGKLSSDPHF